MIVSNDTTALDFDSFNLQDKNNGIDSIEYNINYEHNVNLKSKAFADMLSAIVTKANSEKRFKVIHR